MNQDASGQNLHVQAYTSLISTKSLSLLPSFPTFYSLYTLAVALYVDHL